MEASDGVDLHWIPLGAGRHVVHWSGRAYEAVAAAREHRPPCALYHAALVVTSGGAAYTIEMAPVWQDPEPDRGVVGEGAVGSRWLGRSRWFRYEIRCWRGGRIPDLSYAVSHQRVGHGAVAAAGILEAVRVAPLPVWGRDELGRGEMWNSNSLVAWLLDVARLSPDRVCPPVGGRAPGWRAGMGLGTPVSRGCP